MENDDARRGNRESLRPIKGADGSLRRRLRLRHELVLALLPTVMVLCVLGLLEVLSRQRLLFASLASSAFLIYLDPKHGTNTVRTLTASHLAAALIGLGADRLMPGGYAAAAIAMVATILFMVLADVVHPPAVSTALSFAFRTADAQSLVLFSLALVVIILLVALQRSVLWTLAQLTGPRADAG